MTPRFRLVMNSGPTAGTAYPLEKSEVTIGRDMGNDIVINDPEVSRHHSRLFFQGDNYIIEDRGSTNGTSVNGQKLLGPYTLRIGELITLGEHISFIFESMTPDPEATIISGGLNQPVSTPVKPYIPPIPPIPPTPPPPQPQYIPAPQIQYTPQPQQYQSSPYNPSTGYSGQIPMQPEPKPAKRFPVWLIILILIVLLLVCGCAATLYFMPEEWWCGLFGSILNSMTPGVCPL